MTKQSTKLAPSHQDTPRPSNAELVELATALCHAIERCGASTELTNAISLAADLLTYLKKSEQVR